MHIVLQHLSIIYSFSRGRSGSAFILEEKAQIESSKGDGQGREESSLDPSHSAQPLTHEESSGPWQNESLLAESWSTMGDVDPEDTKSLDSSDGAALTAEENHSSNSDMVHLEREEAEMLEEAEKEGEMERRTEEEEEEEEDEELQTSVLSILGGEREPFEMQQEIHAPVTEELLVSTEESCLGKKSAEFTHAVPLTALPPLPIVKLDPPSTTSTPVHSITTAEAEELYCAQGLHPPSILAPASPETPAENIEQQFQQIPLPEQSSVEATQAAREKTTTPPKATKPPLSSTELMCGGAALVAIVAMVAYGAVAYSRR